MAVDGRVGRLAHEIQHYSFRHLSDQLERINRYTTLAARELHESGRRAGLLELLVHAPAAFVRNYVLRRGFLDGTAGLTLSMVNAYAVFVKFAKLWEIQRNLDAHFPARDGAPAPKLDDSTRNPEKPPQNGSKAVQ